jgi:hypothetical protein
MSSITSPAVSQQEQAFDAGRYLFAAPVHAPDESGGGRATAH